MGVINYQPNKLMKKVHIDAVKIIHFLINKKVYNDFMDFVSVQNINFGIR